MGEGTDNQTVKIKVTGVGGYGSSGGIVGGSSGDGSGQRWLLIEILQELRAIHATLKAKDAG